MNIGLFGGTFDPFHEGHESVIDGVLKSGKADAVIVIPSARPPFKASCPEAAAPYRYYMTKHAVESDFKGRNVFVSDIEFMYPGTSFTATTVKEISKPAYIRTFLKSNGIKEKSAQSNHSFFWITGSDVLPFFDKWQDPEKILSSAGLLVAKRPGDDVDIDFQRQRLKSLYGDFVRLEFFETSEVCVSSSDIREGKLTDKLPSKVRDFILLHKLYDGGGSLSKVSDSVKDMFNENAVKLHRFLGEKRLLHTLNVGRLSLCYASIYDESICEKALIAGQLHDCAKELDESRQRQMAFEYAGDLFEAKKLLHSPAGALMAKEEFGVTDLGILDAITYHTTGRGGMTLLEKIVYVADKLEPSRTYADLTLQREIAKTDLDAALKLVVLSVKEKFESKGQKIHPLTVDLIHELDI